MQNFFLLALFTAFFSVFGNTQIELPEDKVKATFSVQQTDCEAFLVATVKIVPKWHINAMKLPEGSFLFPSSLTFKKSKNFELLGKVVEPKPHYMRDELADEDLFFHEGTVVFKQKIKILVDEPFTVEGTFEYQTCNDVKCLRNADYPISLKIKGCQIAVAEVPTPVIDAPTDVENQALVSADTAKNNSTEKELKSSKIDNVDKKGTVKDKSLWKIFILAFISGLAALLTPCVFPMIPMTVSFFTKRSPSKAKGIQNASIYGLSIILIYVLLGLLVVVTNSASLLNEMSTNPWFNVAFFILLIVFALSFMGAFEIRMPSSWVNKADAKADKGGLIGIFFMALVLALVSFSCTGPILGVLLVGTASQGGGEALLMGMFGFGFALALPFGLFAAFPGWLNSLPQSGGWLNTVKVVLGFLELALAFKFLSNADLALQSHLLERELFLAIWIAIFLVLTIYLFGLIRLPHDSPLEYLSVGRSLMGILTLMFVIYMIPGMFGAPLKLIAAFPPPMSYSESPLGFGGGGSSSSVSSSETVEGMELGPQNIMVFHDYDLALAHAEKVNKPLFVDFTGHNCVNCRRMEQSVWGEPGIIDILRNDVVIVSLHVDERIPLPESERKVVELRKGKMMSLKTTGDKWMYKQLKEYQITAQPYYILQSPKGEDLGNGPADYEHHSKPKDFNNWLKDGLKELDKKK
ncbi:MAG: thioredoxin family protein [Bacteroidetes bacterium]|nr:thioredoxin family protein [Bacteroidota bacterium]